MPSIGVIYYTAVWDTPNRRFPLTIWENSNSYKQSLFICTLGDVLPVFFISSLLISPERDKNKNYLLFLPFDF